MRKYLASFLLVGLLSFIALSSISVSAQDENEEQSSAGYARQLSNTDPAVRQAGAEGLARLVDLKQRKLLEGYLLQEKDKRVRLAIQWALYRLGKSELLFQIVRDFDSSRHDQAVGYLSQLESSEPLYVFIKQEDTHPKILVGLLEVLGRTGDKDTLQQIQPFQDHFEPKVADAAKEATVLIQERLAESQPVTKTRPRTTSKPDQR
jgi:HEAT repeat protein